MSITAGSIRVVRPAAAALAGVAIIGPLASPAGADGCNDIEVVFARAPGKRPASGRVGQACRLLRGQGGQPLHRHLRRELPGDLRLPWLAADGANDASTFIQNVVNNRPDT